MRKIYNNRMQSDFGNRYAIASPLMRGVMWQALRSTRRPELAIGQTPKSPIPVSQKCPKLPGVFFFDPAILWAMRIFFAAKKIILGQISMVCWWHEVWSSLPTHKAVSS